MENTMITTSFRYASPGLRLYSGSDALAELGREVEALGARRAFVICGQSIAHKSPLVERVREILGDRFAGAFSGAAQESPLPAVEAGAAASREARADALVAIGGGSTIVTSRAINILLSEREALHDLCIRYPAEGPPVAPPLDAPKLPSIVVPTTPTTAADTAGAAVTDEAPPYRLEFQDPKLRPTAVILDAGALLSAPLSVFLDTALTLLGGLVVYLQSPALNPYSLADHRQALDLTTAALPQLAANPEEPEPRMELGVAALLCNRAWDAPDPPAAGISLGLQRQLRYRYEQVPQGAVGCVLHLAEMRLHRDRLLHGQVRLARLWGVEAESDEDAAMAATQIFVDLLVSVGAPTRLRELQIPEQDLRSVAEAEAERRSQTQASRRMGGVGELEEFLLSAW
jgi:alcohol dehydrogenase class IV